MQFKATQKVTNATIDLNYEEMVMLRALLQRARNEVIAKFRPNVQTFGPYIYMNTLDDKDYGQGLGESPFLRDLHLKLKEATGA